MAESQRMTTAEVVAKTMMDEHADFVREAVAMVAAELMEAEISTEIGAGRGEVCPERQTHRNGYRPRLWETRVGELELAIPRKRDGSSYFPSFLEPRRPCEQAIVACVMEAYVNGVSTRKVDRLVEQLGIHGMSKDRVSALCRELDERVDAFRERPLEGEFPYLWLDAKHLKIRDRGHVRSKALVVAYAVHETGHREVIGIDIGETETEAFWLEFLRGLRSRGLHGIRLAVSDQHEGLKTAIERILACPWQRCTVHFVRNMQGHCRRTERGLVSAALRETSTPQAYKQQKRGSVTCSSASAIRSRRSPSYSRQPRKTCSPSTNSLPHTGPSSEAPTPWNASTAKSAPMPSASSPTTHPRSDSPAHS